MISFVKGKLEDLNQDSLCINVNGMGYRVFSSAITIGKVTPGEVIKLHTRMIVRDDSISLFGFLGKDELYLFERLITVTGVGPKVAIAILSSMPPEEFAALIVAENVKELMKVPGIGKKTGERLVLELKDKLEALGREFAYEPLPDNRRETVEALISLGFDAAGVRKAISKVDEKGADTAQLIKLCLKILKS